MGEAFLQLGQDPVRALEQHDTKIAGRDHLITRGGVFEEFIHFRGDIHAGKAAAS